MKDNARGLGAMTTTKKRNLFEEIQQGILEVKAHKAGKMQLQTHKLTKKPQPTNRPHSETEKIPQYLATKNKMYFRASQLSLSSPIYENSNE